MKEYDYDYDQMLEQLESIMPKPKKKSVASVAKDNDKQEESIDTLYGFYPKSEESQTRRFKGIDKPVHNIDLSVFASEYGECCVKHIWSRRDALFMTVDGLYLSPDLTRGVDADWIVDRFSGGYYFPKNRAIKAFTLDDDYDFCEVLVSQLTVDRKCFTCDVSGKLVLNMYQYKVTGSKKYKKICQRFVHRGDMFGICGSCGDVFESEYLKEVMGRVAIGKLCPKCLVRHKNEGVIRKHNDKGYPRQIISISSNMGYEIKDGVVWATMKKHRVENHRLYGVEVETELYLDGALKEGVDRFDIAKALTKALGEDFVIIKEDGTLITNGKYSDKAHKYGPNYAGFEVVSAPATLDIHRERWAKLEEFKYFNLLRAWDCDTCGFHVHLSRDAIETDLVGGRMLAFLNCKDNRKFIWKVAGRSEVAFTKYEARKVSDFNKPEMVVNRDEDDHHNRERRVALNISNPNTVEMRIFRGTVNPRHIIRNIEFYDSLLEFCSPCARSISEVYDFKYYVNFVDQNRKRWPLLAAWFAFHEIIKLKKILRPEKVNRDKLTLKINDIPEPELLKV